MARRSRVGSKAANRASLKSRIVDCKDGGVGGRASRWLSTSRAAFAANASSKSWRGWSASTAHHSICARTMNQNSCLRRCCAGWPARASTALISRPASPGRTAPTRASTVDCATSAFSIEWFRTRREAAAIIEAWRRHYNEVCPHSSLGYLTPAAFKQQISATSNKPAEAIL